MESLCYSANKGSDDAYDVSTFLTCCTAIEFGGISAGQKEFMFDGLLAVIGIGVVLRIRSALGSHLSHLDSQKEEFLDKVSLMI